MLSLFTKQTKNSRSIAFCLFCLFFLVLLAGSLFFLTIYALVFPFFSSFSVFLFCNIKIMSSSCLFFFFFGFISSKKTFFLVIYLLSQICTQTKSVLSFLVLFCLQFLLTKKYIFKNNKKGAGESGKSTIAKQMRIIYLEGFSEEEKLHFREVIYLNILISMRSLIAGAKKLQIEIEHKVINHQKSNGFK